MARLGEIAAELGLATGPADPGRASTPSVVESIGTPDPWMAEFLADRTPRAWSEWRLSPRERAIVALTTDIGQQTLGESFRRHVRLALEGGAGPDEVRDAVRFCAEMGLARAALARRELDAVLGGAPS